MTLIMLLFGFSKVSIMVHIVLRDIESLKSFLVGGLLGYNLFWAARGLDASAKSFGVCAFGCRQ